MAALKLRITSWGEVALDKKGLRALMRGAANEVKSKTARLIAKEAGGGRTYYGGGGSAYRGAYRPGRYTASAPGAPPVKVTGSLRNSLKSYVYKEGVGFAVRERQFYALFLEAGAQGGGNPGSRGQRARGRRHRARRTYTARVLAPRPHLNRVMADEHARIDARVKQAFAQGLTWRQTR